MYIDCQRLISKLSRFELLTLHQDEIYLHHKLSQVLPILRWQDLRIGHFALVNMIDILVIH